MYKRKTEQVAGDKLRVGDNVWRHGFLWTVTQIRYEPAARRYLLGAVWSKTGSNPHFFNDDMCLGLVEDLLWTRDLGEEV